MIELNISCPNLGAEHGEMFAASPKAAADVTARVKAATSLPCLVKLSPNVPDIGEVARAVVDAGADGITAINTMPGMVIDAEAGTAVLANETGGISGPALKPIALRCVYDIASAVSVPIIGTGGVLCGQDAVEMICAGATAVGVGSAVFYRGEKTFSLIRDELSCWLKEHDCPSLDQIRGKAHAARARTVVTALPPSPIGRKRMSNVANLPRPFRIKEKIQENPKTISLVLDGSLECAPGQFAMLWLPGVDEKPFSISGRIR